MNPPESKEKILWSDVQDLSPEKLAERIKRLTMEQLKWLAEEVSEKIEIPAVFLKKEVITALDYRIKVLKGLEPNYPTKDHKKLELNRETQQRLRVLRARMNYRKKKPKESWGKKTLEYIDKKLDENLSDDLTRNEKRGAALFTLGVAVVVGWLLKRLLFSGKAGQKAAGQSGGGWFKKTLILIGVGSAAFFGFKAYEKLEDFKDQIEEGKKQLKKLQTKMDEGIKQGEAALEKSEWWINPPHPRTFLLHLPHAIRWRNSVGKRRRMLCSQNASGKSKKSF